MPVTTVSAAFHITPIAIKTFLKHGKRIAKKLKDGCPEDEAQDDIFFDEAFHIVKAFIEMGTRNTVESLQGFTNTHVPAPYWAAVSPVCIPLSSCNRAADILIDWFGPEELKHVVGGERWWQVRGLDGVDGEWIAEKEHLSDEKVDMDIGRKLTDDEEDILRMEKLETVMLYIHGGGFFWGSINSHRFQIIRYARKIKGRAFAVNYRKAPQYPWPCPLQDVLAAYFYLIHPPPNALHKPVSASKIVFAGDSAGGGLCLTVLTVLRDLGLPMPAGAVLISPWVDLTHSFPSVMDNTHSDIIPQYGFLAKPSTLWPVHPLPQEGGRVAPTMSNPPPKPGHTDTLRFSKAGLRDVEKGEGAAIRKMKVQSQQEILEVSGLGAIENSAAGQEKGNGGHSSSNSAMSHEDVSYDVDFWEPKPPKVLMDDPEAVPLELRSQIQLYATTEQLTHPLVSPVLQGSLGNLPPLYILAGDAEVLRDEIIYVAHRAAHPEEFPIRHGVLRDGRRQKENVEKYRTPTKVHLQVFDGMCHVLTVFSFTSSAKYAYRSIAEFVKGVTNFDEDHLKRNPFPELHRPPSEISTENEVGVHRRHQKKSRAKTTVKVAKPQPKTEISETDTGASGVGLFKDNQNAVAQEVENQQTESMPLSLSVSESSLGLLVNSKEKDLPDITMIRERVDIRGRSRSMESKREMSALKVRPAQVGLIKEAPTIRWLKGQEEWDKVYKRSAEKAIKKRQIIEAKAKRMIDNAKDQGLILVADGTTHNIQRRGSGVTVGLQRVTDGTIQGDRRWGPLDLDGERPPPSAIAKRRDTPEALALLKKSIYHTAPITHRTVPKLKTADTIRAAFDPNDDPVKAPKQSVSEQQVRTYIIPIHGLRMWDVLVGYFMRQSSRKAVNGTKEAATAIKNGEHMVS